MLRKVADGLDQREQDQLAAAAYALAWTRACGGYGYSGFGGETDVCWLRQANKIDPALAREVVAAETESVVAAGTHHAYGFSKALIHAFGAGALTPQDTSPIDAAFDAWQEIHAVTDYRAPRVHAFDDPAEPYTPRDTDGCVSRADLDSAFALGVFAGLGHASREKKRRTLLAVRLLLSERPEPTATAVHFALGELSDPATLTWLLRLIETSEATATAVVEQCRQTLIELAGGEYLVARTIARRLLQDDAPPLPPPSDDDTSLLARGGTGIWLPEDHATDTRDGPLSQAEEIVVSVAGSRLRAAAATLPGLRTAVVSQVAHTVASDDYRARLDHQLDHYANRIEQHWPDAYMCVEETVEDALQRVACAGRTALARMGLAGDPALWENRLADLLIDDPDVLLALESRRIPRPALPAPPEPGVDRWREAPTEATLSVGPADNTWVESLIQVRGWPLIATVELQTFQHPDLMDHPKVAVLRHRAPELRDATGVSRVVSLPAAGDMRRWIQGIDDQQRMHPFLGSRPIFGLDSRGDCVGDGRQGLGLQAHLLTPLDALLTTLGLRPSEPFKLDDQHGCGLALLTWRTAYDDGAFSLPRPRLIGSGVAAHPGLIQRLIAATDDELVIRDFVAEVPVER